MSKGTAKGKEGKTAKPEKKPILFQEDQENEGTENESMSFGEFLTRLLRVKPEKKK